MPHYRDTPTEVPHHFGVNSLAALRLLVHSWLTVEIWRLAETWDNGADERNWANETPAEPGRLKMDLDFENRNKKLR